MKFLSEQLMLNAVAIFHYSFKPKGVVTPFLLVIHKGIHEQPLIDELLPLGLFISEISVVVIGDDDAI